MVLERNIPTLRNLLSSLLHLRPEEITYIEIKNPISQSDSPKDKQFILDLKLCINHDTLINLEMQVVNERNWPERSLSYLCRTYDQLHRGQDYLKTMPAIHIGFLDFQPFAEYQEFYASYQLLNIKNHHLYSDKFRLHVLDLTHIELATTEDCAYQIDQWARLFKATTWEEIKMISANNESMNDALQTLYECNIDENILEQCYARAEQLKKEKYYRETLAAQAAALQEKDEALQKKDAALSEKDAEIAHLKALLAEKK